MKRPGYGPFCSALLTFVILTCCSSRLPQGVRDEQQAKTGSILDDASKLLREYFELESNQKYSTIYSLLSKGRKKYLEKFHVRTAREYSELRTNTEARWSDFVVESRTAPEDWKVVFTGHARVEESGESEKVKFKCVVIKEEGRWKIDDWAY